MFSTPPLKPQQILSTEYNYILCKPCAVYHIYLNQFDQKHSQNLSPLTKHLLGIKTNHPSYLNFASSIQPYIVHLFCFGHAYKIKIIHTTKHCFCLFTIIRTKMKENIMIIISLVHFCLFSIHCLHHSIYTQLFCWIVHLYTFAMFWITMYKIFTHLHSKPKKN